MARCRRGRDGGVVGDRHGGEGGAGAVVIRHRMGGTQTARHHRRRCDGGLCLARCPRGGTQTVITRRPHRSGAGYVITRCRRSGTQAAMLRRARCGGGSLMARCPRRGGCATAVGRRDAETAPSRCYVCARLVSHPSTSVRQGYIDGVGKGATGGFTWMDRMNRMGAVRRRASPPGPLSNIWRGGGVHGMFALTLNPSPRGRGRHDAGRRVVLRRSDG